MEKTLFVKFHGKHFKKINFKSIISIVKKEFKSEYSCIQTVMVETAIKKYVDSFNGFIALKNNEIDGKYNQEVSPSKKHDDNRLHKIIISKESITSSKKKLEACYIELALKESIKKQLESSDADLE